MWFLNHALKLFSVRLTYVSEVLLSLWVTLAWYITDDCRQFPASGQVSFDRQLQVILVYTLLARYVKKH